MFSINGVKMKGLLAFFLLLTLPLKAQEVHKAVIDLRTGDISKFENSILKGIPYVIETYRTKLEDLKVVVVAHGNSYKFFLKSLKNTPYENDKKLAKKQKEIGERLKNLVDVYKVRFEICEAGMKARKIPIKNLYPFVKPIPTALNGIIHWQEEGYKYMLFE